jgi:acetyl-CoA carboxylase beta subunit
MGRHQLPGETWKVGLMSKNPQEFNNRSQGQRLRRTRERLDEVTNVVVDHVEITAQNTAITAQNTRDIRMMKAQRTLDVRRIAELERALDRTN